MKKYIVLIFCTLIFFTLTSPGLASRVLIVPTADLLTVGNGELDYHHLRGQGSLELNIGFHPRVNLGIKQNFGDILLGTVKVSILGEKVDVPGLAVGGELGLDRQDVFFVLSKQLGTPVLRTHFAWGTGRFSGGMAGVNLVLNPVQVKSSKGWAIPTTSLALEYDGNGLNAGLIAQFSPEFKVYLATTFNKGLGLGLNYKVAF